MQEDSIHFIHYLNNSNKIYKYTEQEKYSEDKQYGSIELVKKLDVESGIKLSFMIDYSDKYEDSYQYLLG